MVDPFAGSHVAHFPERSTRNGQIGRVAAKGAKLPLRVDNHSLTAFESQWADWTPKTGSSQGAKSTKSPQVAHAILLQVPDGVPAEWVQGIADLLVTPPHPDWPEAAWRILKEDALGFLNNWAAQAHALGWDALNLFAIHGEAPIARPDGMGLVPVLGGRPVVAITEDRAAIGAESGGTLTFRRHKAPPLDRCLIWEL
jgi:hypothetical protein